MRIGDLSDLSGVPVATIKFYVREGLLPPGELTKPNQAVYSAEHLRRLRLVRALLQFGGLSVSTAKQVLDVIDSDEPLFRLFGAAQRAVSEPPSEVSSEALAQVDRLMEGWRIASENPGRYEAARIWSSIAAEGAATTPVDDRWFSAYAEAAMKVARADIEQVDARADREGKAEMVVVGTVLGDRLFGAFRRAAGEHVAGERYRDS